MPKEKKVNKEIVTVNKHLQRARMNFSDAFQFLDRDNDGFVGKEDVAGVLGLLGQDRAGLDAFFQQHDRLDCNQFSIMMRSFEAQVPDMGEVVRALKVFNGEDMDKVDLGELKEHLGRVEGFGSGAGAAGAAGGDSGSSNSHRVLEEFSRELMDGQQVFSGSKLVEKLDLGTK